MITSIPLSGALTSRAGVLAGRLEGRPGVGEFHVAADLAQRAHDGVGVLGLFLDPVAGAGHAGQAAPGHEADQGHERQGHQHFHQREAGLRT